ncbi:hypothetical protein EON66_08420 [archaeon]|nr:MAG: hypothetical protein EON66_08420 [archaeon]
MCWTWQLGGWCVALTLDIASHTHTTSTTSPPPCPRAPRHSGAQLTLCHLACAGTLLSAAGASATFLEASIPYAREATHDVLAGALRPEGSTPFTAPKYGYSSMQTAVQLALSSLAKSKKLVLEAPPAALRKVSTSSLTRPCPLTQSPVTLRVPQTRSVHLGLS